MALIIAFCAVRRVKEGAKVRNSSGLRAIVILAQFWTPDAEMRTVMKNTLMLTILLFIGVAVSAQTHHNAKKEDTPKVITPPDSVTTAFQAKFSGMTPTWQVTPAGNFCAVMDNGGKKEYAEFDSSGKWLRTKTDLDLTQLSDAAKTALQTQYPGMEIAAVQKLEYENVNPFYKVDLKQGDQEKSVMVNDAGYIQE
jgi:hypothetical protein